MVKIAKVEMFICEYCDHPYDTERKAKNCEKSCVERLEREKRFEKQKELSMGFCNELKSIDQVPFLLKKYLEELYNVKILVIGADLKYCNEVSNSHSAPLRGVSNFSRSPDKPLSYEGYLGKISIICSREKGYNTFDTDMIGNKTLSVFSIERGVSCPLRGISVQYGGGRNELNEHGQKIHRCTYNVRMFVDDFPELRKQLNLKKLKSKDFKVD